MRVTVTLPVRAVYRSDITIPESALDDIQGYLDENPDVRDDILDGAELCDEEPEWAEIQVVD